jgi:hypothetical protein
MVLRFRLMVNRSNGLKHQKEKRSMDHFTGLDVSVKETSVCIVDDAGRTAVRRVGVRNVRLVRGKTEHFVLPRPFGWQVGKASDAHTAREPAVDGMRGCLLPRDVKRRSRAELRLPPPSPARSDMPAPKSRRRGCRWIRQ